MSQQFLPNQSTLAHVRRALVNGGYSGNEEILSSHFRGYNKSGREIHRITFTDHEGETAEGHVYVEYRDGRPVGDY